MHSLLNKVYDAVTRGEIIQPFTTQDIKNWINQYKILNDQTHCKYSETYIEGFLSSSTVGSSSTKHDKTVTQIPGTPFKYHF